MSELWKSHWRSISFLIYSFLVTLGTTFHEPWRDEWQAYWIAVKSESFWELIRNLRYEAHPPLWYLWIKVVNGLGLGPTVTLKISSLLVAFAVAFLLIRKCSWKPQTLCLILLNYFLVYEYSVISRGYLLGAFFLFVAAFELRKTKIDLKSDLKIALSLILACGTEILSGVLGAFLGCYWIFKKHGTQKRWPIVRGFRVHEVFLYLSTMIGAALGLFLVRPAPDMVFFKDQTGFHWDYSKLKQTVAILAKNIIVFPDVFRSDVWNSNLISTDLALLIGIFLIPALFRIFKKDRLVYLFFVGSQVVLLVLHYTQYIGFKRHQGFLLISLFIAIVLTQDEIDLTRRMRIFLKSTLVLGAITGLFFIATDVVRPFSNTAAIGEKLNADSKARFIVTEPDYLGSAIKGTYEGLLYDKNRRAPYYFVRWDQVRQIQSPSGLDLKSVLGLDVQEKVMGLPRPRDSDRFWIGYIHYLNSDKRLCDACLSEESFKFEPAMSDESLMLEYLAL